MEADTPADFGSALGALLGRTEELRLLVAALDGDIDDGDDTDGGGDGGGPDDDPGGAAVGRLLLEAGIST